MILFLWDSFALLISGNKKESVEEKKNMVQKYERSNEMSSEMIRIFKVQAKTKKFKNRFDFHT